jgi:hypothetical protein
MAASSTRLNRLGARLPIVLMLGLVYSTLALTAEWPGTPCMRNWHTCRRQNNRYSSVTIVCIGRAMPHGSSEHAALQASPPLPTAPVLRCVRTASAL